MATYFSTTDLGVPIQSPARTGTTRRYYPNGALYQVYTSNVNGLKSSFETKAVTASGYTPGYHGLVKKGALVGFTSRAVSKSFFQSTAGQFTGNKKKSLSYRTCDLDHEICEGTSHAVEYVRISYDDPALPDRDLLLNSAAAKARSGALQLMVEIAEARKTRELVMGSVNTMKKRVNHVTRETKGRYKHLFKVQDIFDAFCDTWLEGRYGWNQMVYSANDLVKAVDNMSKPQTYIVTGKDWTVSTSPTGSIVQLGIGRHPKAQSAYSYATTFQNTYVGRATVAVKISRHAKAVDLNIPAFAWEIVPYSFVVDWFVNVGDLLKAHWPNPFISGQVASYSLKRTVRCDSVITVPSATTCGETHGSTPVQFAFGKESYSRTPIAEIPFNLSMYNGLDKFRAIDLVALIPGRKQIAQLYRRIRV